MHRPCSVIILTIHAESQMQALGLYSGGGGLYSKGYLGQITEGLYLGACIRDFTGFFRAEISIRV